MNDPDLLSFSEVAFLAAQTGWNSSSDWDARLESSAAAFESTVDALRIVNLGPEFAHMIRGICSILKKIFTSHDKYLKFLAYRGEAAQDLLDILQKVRQIVLLSLHWLHECLHSYWIMPHSSLNFVHFSMWLWFDFAVNLSSVHGLSPFTE